MKRVLFLLVVLFLSVSTYAQQSIQKEILGVKLGVSSKNVVVQKLKSSKYKPIIKKDGTIEIHNADYAKLKWEATFSFFKGKLYQVKFLRDGTEREIKKQYAELGEKLLKRYHAFYTDEMFPQFSLTFNDKVTEVTLFNAGDNDNYRLMFLFSDIKLKNLHEDGF